jgi:hypothetical protein
MGAVSFDEVSCVPQSIWGFLPNNAHHHCRPAIMTRWVKKSECIFEGYRPRRCVGSLI